MVIVSTDKVVPVPPGSRLDFTRQNPLQRLVDLVTRVRLATERHAYLTEHTQYLFPYETLELAGPAGAQWQELDPARQDNKGDIQKQLVRGFRTADAYLLRGWVSVGDWTGPFLRISYEGGPDSRLSGLANHQLGPAIKMWLKVGNRATPELLTVPYNPETSRYDVELWGYPGNDLARNLEGRGRVALDRGELLQRPDLIQGTFADLSFDGADDRVVTQVAPSHAMHPLRPLSLEIAWCDTGQRWWDSQEGANHHYQFNMIVRGRNHFLASGIRPSLYGGVGTTQFRALFANGLGPGLETMAQQFEVEGLGRELPPWGFDAFGRKSDSVRSEPFLAVDYMDLLMLKSDSGIGLHRHRDNQDIFLLLRGHATAVVGDWCKMPSRERCFEVRTLRERELVLVKPGSLHGLMNMTDTDVILLAFGGHD
jgi:mannose-6-phosphate isomerase-like protein (cupin superfamily)